MNAGREKARIKEMTGQGIDKGWFRKVLGHYPTGVCVITSTTADGRPAGLTVGSFTSVSLEPPLVAFFPDKSSSSWPKIEATGQFCVNILGADQQSVCRQLAAKSEDKFAGITHRHTATGLPIIDNCVAWIDCAIHSVGEAGDHYVVMGLVREMNIESGGNPLLFFQGGYGQFAAAG
jgi:3-hydroxy-9,10-secoandrosta-1,3,5(10)-triene-9,17-dione monooxygenase reductase component